MQLTDTEIATLIAEAQKAMAEAHAPYSNFTVGCAVLMEDGSIHRGANVENASYGAAICAERSAISSAMSQGHRGLRAVCVTNATDTKITPCGICRQVIYEFSRDVPVICTNQSGEHMILSISELLPHAFTLDQ
ncbi:cytidine deaminase [Roseovarius sp. MMSF_3359]|uniref:cytidine deaminase n=1 Tax=unclassified Roseovarius TaxID=2614913 RepID=UPI003531F04C